MINLSLFKISDQDNILSARELSAGFIPNQSDPFYLERHISVPLRHIQDTQNLKSQGIWSGMVEEHPQQEQTSMKHQGEIYKEINAFQKNEEQKLLKRNKQYLVYAGFDLKHWHKALKLLSSIKADQNQLHWDFARLHLITANVAHFIPKISPYLTPSAQALRQIRDEDFYPLLVLKDDVSLALIAYASRFIDQEDKLLSLLNLIKANDKDQQKQSDFLASQDEHLYYKMLPSAQTSLRKMLELRGTKSIVLLLKNQEWALDRGFEHSLMFYDFAKNNTNLSKAQIIESLQSFTDAYELKIIDMLAEQEIKVIQPWVDLFLQNQYQEHLNRDDLHQQELILATKISIALKSKNQQIPISDLSKKLCVVFDRQIAKLIQQSKLLAAQAYLSLSAHTCHATPYALDRFREFLNQRAMLSLDEKDFNLAHYFFKASGKLHGDQNALSMAVELLSQISLIYASEQKNEEGRYYLSEAIKIAQNLPEEGERFKLAKMQYPKADIKAKIALLIMIVIIGFFAISRIIKLIYPA